MIGHPSFSLNWDEGEAEAAAEAEEEAEEAEEAEVAPERRTAALREAAPTAATVHAARAG